MMIRPVAVSVLALGLALGLPLASAPAHAQLFGPSDEEKAREAAQDSGIQDLQGISQQQDVRIRALEDKVRGLTESLSRATGANEELNHQLQLQNEKLDRAEKDFAYRLCTLSAQQLGANDSINCAAAGTPSAGAVPYSPPAQGMRPGDALPPVGAVEANPPDNRPAVLGRPPGTLGSLPAGTAYGGPPPGGPPAAGTPPAPAGGSAQYDQAMNLMGRAQYSEAAAAFRAYADANPDDTDLAPQAIYWVGNISFIRQDYAPAARTFAEVIKKYPKSSRAPDAMLKLAQSFMAMGQKSEGCTTLGLIRTKYPNAAPQTLTSAASLRKTACSR
jgi:tol-pal system protein YbgF